MISSAFRHQHGNVLFLILIAVALFAALSYAVTSSTRTGGSSVSKDKARANAASIVQYSTGLRNAIMRMKVSNGCTDTTLDFVNTVYKYADDTAIALTNPNAPLNNTCSLFRAEGGGMAPVIPVPDALTEGVAGGQPKPGHGAFRVLQIKGLGTDGTAGTASANDLVFQQSYINRETCIAINDLVGVNNPGGSPPDAASLTTDYLGSYASNELLDNADTNGKPVFCRYQSAATRYQYFHALIER